MEEGENWQLKITKIVVKGNGRKKSKIKSVKWRKKILKKGIGDKRKERKNESDLPPG